MNQGRCGRRVSIVVPILDEAAALPGLLDRLAGLRGDPDVIVVDGGSTDGGIEIVAGHPLGARIVKAPRGRAVQCNAGAAAASGEVLLFLHADTTLPPDAIGAITSACADARVVGGNFALRFDGGDLFSRVLTAYYAVQRRWGGYYGDSAIWVRRSIFERMGGFHPMPIMEDHELVRRLRRAGRDVCLPGPAITSARRWQTLGLAKTLFSWSVIRWLYLAGVSPERLARMYPAAR